MAKIYSEDIIEDRIKEIAIAEKSQDNDDSAPSY